MTGKEFEQIIRISFERKKFTNLIIDKKLFRNFAHVYCKSAVRPGMFHYNLKEKTEVVKPFYGFYFGLSFLGDVQQPRPVFPLDVYAPEIISQTDTGGIRSPRPPFFRMGRSAELRC